MIQVSGYPGNFHSDPTLDKLLVQPAGSDTKFHKGLDMNNPAWNE